MINFSIVFLTNFVTFLLLSLFMIKINGDKKDIKFFGLLYIICIALINTFFEYSMIILPVILIRLLFYYTICRITCRSNRLDSVIDSLIYFIILFIIEIFYILVQNIMSNISTYAYITGNSNYKDLASIAISTGMLFVPKIKLIIKNINNFKTACYKRKKYIKYAILFFVALLITIIIYLSIRDINNQSGVLVSITIIILVFTIFFFIAMFNNYRLKNFNNYLIELNDTYEKVLSDYKMFKHNIKHELTAIGNIGGKKVQRLIHEFIEEYESNYELNVDLTDIPVSIKGIIHQSILRNRKFNIEIKSKVSLYSNFFDNLNEKLYLNLCESFGIIVDNAIEALQENDYLYIEISEYSEKYELTCINEFKGNIDIDYFGFICTTTKKEHMGMGIMYLVNKNKLKTEFKILNNKFIAKLIIKK